MTKFLLIKLQLEVCNFMKIETLGPLFFCEFCDKGICDKFCDKHLFYKAPLGDCFCMFHDFVSIIGKKKQMLQMHIVRALKLETICSDLRLY